ncbi:MAG: ABC transporter ATP-binding protein [Gammaproteobacteria bacterium]|nr:ABC transporter ATP-binding protein [Gammaproteobacteria bacterium]
MSEYRIENLCIERGEKVLCANLSLEFKLGQCWGILGANGAGKTTLLHTMAGLYTPRAGRRLVQNTELDQLNHIERAKRLGLLFQHNPNPFPSSVEETALQGRHPHLNPWQWETDHDKAQAIAALRRVELEGLKDRQVDSLSGGERQRLAIATLLTQNPTTLLLDEPINHLDLHHQIKALGLFANMAREQQHLVIMSMHDINLAQRFCDHMLLMFAGGKVIYGETAKVMTKQNLTQLYCHSMLQIEGPHGPLYVPE